MDYQLSYSIVFYGMKNIQILINLDIQRIQCTKFLSSYYESNYHPELRFDYNQGICKK